MGTAGSQPSSPSSPSSSSSAAAAAAVTSVVSSALHSRSNTTHKKNKKKTMATTTTKRSPTAPYVRRAHHAGSWYESSKSMLDAELTEYLTAAADEQQQQQQQQAHDTAVVENGDSWAADPASGATNRSSSLLPRAIVSPHAGYRYSGPTAAHAYLALREAVQSKSDRRVRTVVVLHPSHHVRLDGCALSGASTIETPLANLLVDDDLRSELLSTGQFTVMDRRVDEHEHSGEMQYPYVAKLLNDAKAAAASAAQTPEGVGESEEDQCCRILPIMVGALNVQQERHYGRLLGPILSRSDVFTVISSDFCHWGQRFGYMPLPPPPVGSNGSKSDDGRSGRNGIRATPKQQHQQTVVQTEEIYQYIQRLDEIGMDHISLQNPGAFAEYLRHYSNTICGRHPIGVWLNSLVCNRDAGRETVQVEFVKYDQSGQVMSVDESSVSYASAVAREVMS